MAVYDPEKQDEQTPGNAPGGKNPTKPGSFGGGQAQSKSRQAARDAIHSATAALGGSSGDKKGDKKAGEGGKGGGFFSGAMGGGGGSDDKDSVLMGDASAYQKYQAIAKEHKGLLFGGLAAGSIVATLGVVFFMLIPLKIEHIIDNLQNHYYASSENAVDNATENFLSTYIKKYVLPALTKCGGDTVDKNCNPNITLTGKNPVQAMFKGWSQARLENKLTDNYGIEFKAVKTGSVTKYYMKAPGIVGDQDITKLAGDDGDLFKEMNRQEVREYVKTSMQGETKWKQLFYRYKVGRLLEEKYGITRCIFFCNGKDALKDFSDKKKEAAQVWIAQRVLTPLDESRGIMFQCLLSSTCDPEKTEPTQPEPGTDGELNGTPENPDVDTAARTSLEEMAAARGFDDEAIKKILADYEKIQEDGFAKYAINYVLEKVGLADISENVTDALPIIGWIKTFATVIAFLNKAGPAIRKLDYVLNSAGAVSMFMLYRTYADEIHTGQLNNTTSVDATEVGSMVDSLGAGNQGAPTDPELGGTASAEETPYYHDIIDNSEPTSTTTTTATLLSGIFGIGNASAAAASPSVYPATSGTYACDNGGTIPAGKDVCNTDLPSQGFAALDAVHNFLNLPFISLITSAASFIAKWAGVLGNLIGTLLNFLGIGQLTQFITGWIQPFITDLMDDVLRSNIGSNMSGGRKVIVMGEGADISGQESCEAEGCQEVTPVQQTRILNEQIAEQTNAFQHETFFARMFDTSSQYSLISQIAMDVPISFQSSLRDGFASLLSNPFGALSNSFSSIFSGRVSAAAAVQADSFNVTQYAMPTLPNDLGAYWDQNCSDGADGKLTQAWQQAAADGPTDSNGMPQHMTPDYCLLIQTATGSAGGLFDSSLLTSDDLADQNGTAGSTTGGVTVNGPAALKVAQDASNSTAKKVGFSLYNANGAQLASGYCTQGQCNTTPLENYGASITKAMLLVAYLNQVGGGTLTTQARTELTNMIEVSDNDAANCVFAYLSGTPATATPPCAITNRAKAAAAVNAVASAAGMSGFQLDDTSDPVYVLGQSKITAGDFAQFFSQIGNLITTNSQQTFGLGLLSNLSAADQNGLLQAGLPGTVYSKEGWKPEDSGLDGAPYIVNQAAQFTSNGTVYGVAVTVGGTADQSSGETIVKNVVQALLTTAGN